MIRFLRRLFQRPEPDLEAFLDDLRAATLGDSYGRLDRYRDFRAVFGTEQGKRVLWELLGWCRIYQIYRGHDTTEIFRREGRRNIGLRLLATMNEEPVDRPDRAINEDNGNANE